VEAYQSIGTREMHHDRAMSCDGYHYIDDLSAQQEQLPAD
jgi:hypothetical protein